MQYTAEDHLFLQQIRNWLVDRREAHFQGPDPKVLKTQPLIKKFQPLYEAHKEELIGRIKLHTVSMFIYGTGVIPWDVLKTDRYMLLDVLELMIDDSAAQLAAVTPRASSPTNGPVEGLSVTVTDINDASTQHSNRGILQPFDESGRTKIGDVYLDIPPEQIGIIDANSVIPIPIIRSHSSVKLRSGQGQIRVELNIEVASIDDFNNRIRPLLAQIKRAPWLPIENWHLKKILLPVHPLDNPEVVSELVEIADIVMEDPAQDSEHTGAAKIHTEDRATREGKSPNAKTRTIRGKSKIAGLQAKEVTSHSDMDLFLIVESLSIQTVPGYPGSFYLNLTTPVFNHTPYVDKIKYLVDDSYVQTVIDVYRDNKKRVNSTSKQQSEKVLHDYRDMNINTTTDISLSKVFKKYYQGLLTEYQTISTMDRFDGSPAKTYEGYPYRAIENEMMHPLTADGAQDITMRGWVNPKSTRELIFSRLDHLDRTLKQAMGIALPTTESESFSLQVGTLTKELVSELWEGTADVIRLMYNYLPSLTEKALNGNKWNLSNQDGDLYILNTKATKWVLLEDYIDEIRDDEKTKDLVRVIQELMKIQDVLVTEADYIFVDVPLTNDEKTTVTGITARYNTGTVPIHMQAHEFPTVQHMGRGEFTCTVNVQTTDFNLVRKIRFLNFLLNRTKKRYDASGQRPNVGTEGISQKKDVRQIRRAFFKDFSIEVLSKAGDQSNFLNAIGIKKVLITDATYSTVKGSPGLWSITMNLMQNDIDIIRQEAIFSGNAMTESFVMNVLSYLKTLGKHLKGEDKTELQNAIETWPADQQPHTEEFPMPKSKIWTELALEMHEWYALLAEKNARDAAADSFNEKTESLLGGNTAVHRYVEEPALSGLADLAAQSTGQISSALLSVAGGAALLPLFGPIAPLLGLLGAGARLGLGRLLLEASTLAGGYRIMGRVRSYLIRTDIAALLPEFLVDEFREIFKKTDPGFDVCYPDLSLPGFTNVDPDDPLATAKHPAIYTAPDFYIFKETLFTDEMLSLAKSYNTSFDGLVSEIERINSVNKQGQATRTKHDIREAVRGANAEKVFSLKNEKAKELENERNELQADLDIIDALIDGKSPLDAPTPKASLDKRAKDLLIEKKALVQRRLQSVSENGDITMAVEEATEEQLQRYLFGFQTNQSQEIADKILDDITNDMANLRYRDKTFQMAKAFPTLKVYFVEQDSNHLLSFNDVYSYNGINSVDVIWSRKSASKTAVINMTNLTGTLTDPLGIKLEEVFSIFSSDKNTRFDTAEEQEVDGIYVQAGLRVIIKMGYSNDPYDLENVFDGIVVSVKGGENIEIICQSHAVELNNIIGHSGSEGIHINRPIKDIILNPFKKLTKDFIHFWFGQGEKLPPEAAYGVGYGDVVKRIFRESGDLSQFGKGSPFMDTVNFQPETPDEQLKTVFIQGVIGLATTGVPITSEMSRRIYHWLFDHKDDNIWITWNNSLPWYAGQERKRSDWGFDWYIYNQSGFDAINELLLWFPDHVFMEMPYNDDNLKMQRSTLYVGPRTGLYLSEDIDPVTNPRLFDEWQEFITQKTWGNRLPGGASKAEVTDEGLVRISVATPETFGTAPNRINDIDIHGEAIFPVRPPLLHPPEINSHFGRRRDPNNPSQITYHGGVDYPVTTGTPIVATIDGVVHQSNSAKGGWIMKIKNKRVEVGYYHLSQRNVESGVSVKAGQLIGATGGTKGKLGAGNSTGPHLHYTVRIDGEAVDPEGLSMIMKNIKKDQDRLRLNPNAPGNNQDIAITDALKIIDKKKELVELNSLSDYLNNPEVQRGFDISTGNIEDLRDPGIDVEQTFSDIYSGQSREARPRNPEDLVGAPGFRRVTHSHFFDSLHHIISNDIEATTQYMWNRVILKYPDIAPIPHPDAEVGFARRIAEGAWIKVRNPGLGKQNLGDAVFSGIEAITHWSPGRDNQLEEFDLWLDRDMDSVQVTPTLSFQKNIDLGVAETVGFLTDPSIANIPLYYRIANSILANGMREMYSGSITVLLDPSVRPWDRCHIFDYHNQIYGPIGVESVHHHFDFQSGATTTIVPDLIVHQTNYPSMVRDTWMQSLLEINLGLKVAGTALGTLSGARFGPIGMAVGALGAFAASTYHADKIFFTMGGYLMGRESGLIFSGLWKDGVPYTAGTRGMRKETTHTMLVDKIQTLGEFTKKILGVHHG